ncbi:MAG: hypothetical protein WBP59_05675 [Ilumatobacteraceae bacterium]
MVIDVRFPPLNYLQTIHKSWREIRVRVNAESERFFVPHGVKDEPFVCEIAPGDVAVVVINSAHERLRLDFVLAVGSVQVVMLFPQLTRFSFGQREHQLVLGERYRIRANPRPDRSPIRDDDR